MQESPGAGIALSQRLWPRLPGKASARSAAFNKHPFLAAANEVAAVIDFVIVPS